MSLLCTETSAAYFSRSTFEHIFCSHFCLFLVDCSILQCGCEEAPVCQDTFTSPYCFHPKTYREPALGVGLKDAPGGMMHYESDWVVEIF